MNKKPLKPCKKFGCGNLTRNRYCNEHQDEQTKQNRYYDRYSREERTVRFYASAAWKRLRELIKIRNNGLCQLCLKDKRIVIGTIVDHIIPIKVNWSLRLDEDNLQLLCQACHNKKTAEESRR
ncbi:HNH endonuclease [bacterium LRH843]|nr:HNH endonuclease [bacterium LRH843]